MRSRNHTLGPGGRANRPFPRALHCDPWWAIRGTGEPYEPIFAELMYGLEPKGPSGTDVVRVARRRHCTLAWGPAIGIAPRRLRRSRH